MITQNRGEGEHREPSRTRKKGQGKKQQGKVKRDQVRAAA